MNGMGLPVGGQLPRLRVAVPAYLAYVRSFPRVRPIVRLQGPGIPKRLPARRTHLIFYSQMGSLVCG